MQSALKAQIESALGSRFGSPFAIREKRAPRLMPTGISEVDAAIGGLPRGAITEIVGPASSGRTTLVHAMLGVATAREEACALVDATNSFDPPTAQTAGVDLRRLLWVRSAARKRQALQVADLLLQGGGFGLIVMDLADITPRDARRIPLSTWFRYRRAVEHTDTAFVIVGQQAYAGSATGLTVHCGLRIADCGFAGLLESVTFEVVPRKRVDSVPAKFRAKAIA